MAQDCQRKQVISDMCILWHNVIRVPQGVLSKGVAGHEIKCREGPQIQNRRLPHFRLWPVRDVNFHVIRFAMYSNTSLSQNPAIFLTLNRSWLSRELWLITQYHVPCVICSSARNAMQSSAVGPDTDEFGQIPHDNVSWFQKGCRARKQSLVFFFRREEIYQQYEIPRSHYL